MRLLWKLLGINILVIVIVVIIVWWAVDYLASGYFVTLMKEYHISPTASHHMFVSAVHRYLIWASLAAILAAAALSYWLMDRVLGPLAEMARTTARISAGDYTGKIPIRSRDEVGELAASFNDMVESLERIEGLRKKMVIDVAHELRTPLTNLRGYLEGLMDGVIPPNPETFQLLHEEALRLARLVEDLLQLAKADAAKAHLHIGEGSLSALVLQALEPFRPQFSSKQIKLQVQWERSAEHAKFDAPKLRRILDNLIQNAWQYTQPGGTARIYNEAVPGGLKVVFANTGGEIAPADLPLIFERFYRGEKSRSREHGGAGIGLAVVKELVAAHNGAVGAEIVGDETRIWFLLPR
jgi:two-component system, OmpR family, sensor histidine kinase BaeS